MNQPVQWNVRKLLNTAQLFEVPSCTWRPFVAYIGSRPCRRFFFKNCVGAALWMMISAPQEMLNLCINQPKKSGGWTSRVIRYATPPESNMSSEK